MEEPIVIDSSRFLFQGWERGQREQNFGELWALVEDPFISRESEVEQDSDSEEPEFIYSPLSLKILTMRYILSTQSLKLDQTPTDLQEFSKQFFKCHFCSKYSLPGQFCPIIKENQDPNCSKCFSCIPEMVANEAECLAVAQSCTDHHCWHRVLKILRKNEGDVVKAIIELTASLPESET